MPRAAVPFENVAEMLEQLGGINPRRVRSWPPPGQATEKDLLTILDRENRICELVDGVLVEKVIGMKESLIAADVIGYLSPFVKKHDLGIVAGTDGPFRLLTRLIRFPDVAFVSWEQLPDHEYPTKPIPDLHPDLAVEVLSEGNTDKEMERKLKEHFLAGTRLVWFVDSDRRRVTVYNSPDDAIELGESDTLTGGRVLPGFSLALKSLFARLPKPPRKNGKRSKK
jgi:Uma2 family endonuclease